MSAQARKPGVASQPHDNMRIWSLVEQTDPKFTKHFDTGQFSGTSINPVYQYRLATELFGPIGRGWGWEIIDEGMDEGVPIILPMLDGSDVIRTTELHHWMRVKVWYVEDGETYWTPEHYGITRYRYTTRKGGLISDPEARKKSETDAVSKALASLGFGADIRSGQYDDPEYVKLVAEEFTARRQEQQAERSDDRAAAEDRARKELFAMAAEYGSQIEKAQTVNELRGLLTEAIRKLNARRAVAHLTGDAEKCMRRIDEIASERKAQLKAQSGSYDPKRIPTQEELDATPIEGLD